MDQVPVYYCVDCGYVGNTPGNCPECGGAMIADDVSLPNENEGEDRYDDDLLDEMDDENKDDKDLG